jgi:hypothetical protein
MNLVLEAPSDLPMVQPGVELALVREAFVGFRGVDEDSCTLSVLVSG